MEMTTLAWGLFAGATAVQLLYWLGIFSRLAFHHPRAPDQMETPPVSVVICAHNEAANLRKNLPYFLEQDYPSFEVIVVDDHSVDATRNVLVSLQKKYAHLRILDPRDSAVTPGKKAALAAGINAAAHALIALSDADCRPATGRWLYHLQAPLRNPAQVVLGYSPYLRAPGWLNCFIRYEAVYTAIQYLSMALAGLPYMGVGRNLAYRRELFLAAGGFQSHAEIASGDDDLFVNAVAEQAGVAVALHPAAFVYSQPKQSWRAYYAQKQRHLTTGRHYRPLHLGLLGLLAVSHLLHYLAGAALLLAGLFTSSVVVWWLLRTGVVWSISAMVLVKLQDRSLIPWIPLLDAAFLGYYLLLTPAALFGRTDRW